MQFNVALICAAVHILRDNFKGQSSWIPLQKCTELKIAFVNIQFLRHSGSCLRHPWALIVSERFSISLGSEITKLLLLLSQIRNFLWINIKKQSKAEIFFAFVFLIKSFIAISTKSRKFSSICVQEPFPLLFFPTHMTFVLQCCSLQIKQLLTEIVCFYSICPFSNSPNVCGFVIKSPIGRYIRKLYVFQLGNYQLHMLIIIHIIIIVTMEDNSCGLLSQYSVIYSRYCPENVGTEFSFSCEDILICI